MWLLLEELELPCAIRQCARDATTRLASTLGEAGAPLAPRVNSELKNYPGCVDASRQGRE